MFSADSYLPHLFAVIWFALCWGGIYPLCDLEGARYPLSGQHHAPLSRGLDAPSAAA